MPDEATSPSDDLHADPPVPKPTDGDLAAHKIRIQQGGCVAEPPNARFHDTLLEDDLPGLIEERPPERVGLSHHEAGEFGGQPAVDLARDPRGHHAQLDLPLDSTGEGIDAEEMHLLADRVLERRA